MDPILQEWFKLHKFCKGFDFLTKDLAKYLNVSPRTIQRWIKGQTKPNSKELTKIKDYLEKKRR
jgi:DNA-binding transcriptional regulator YiaG